MLFILDENNLPIKLEPSSDSDMTRFREFMGKGQNIIRQSIMIARDGKDYLVSTVFLPVSPSLDSDPMFETMIFPSPESGSDYRVRCRSYEEAVRQHEIAESFAGELIVSGSDKIN